MSFERHCCTALINCFYTSLWSGPVDGIVSYNISSHICMCHHQVHFVTKNNKLDNKLQR